MTQPQLEASTEAKSRDCADRRFIMPNCFQLTRKGETEASKLSAIDTELCAMLGVDEDPKRYVCSWVDTIGYALALGVPLIGPDRRGQTMEDVMQWTDRGSTANTDVEDMEYVRKSVRILNYLREHFTSSAWAQAGSRE